MKMLPMSLWESRESTGLVSVKELFSNPEYDIDGKTSKLSVEDLILAACRGGWPASLIPVKNKVRLLVAKNYLKSVCSEDISRIDGVQRDEKTAAMIMRSYARNISTVAKRHLCSRMSLLPERSVALRTLLMIMSRRWKSCLSFRISVPGVLR